MTVHFVVFFVAYHRSHDVAVSQAYNLDVLLCHSWMNSARMIAGRIQAAYTSQWGRADSISSVTTLQENRSRGCRRVKWFSRCAWLHLLQAALLRKMMLCMLMALRFRPSRQRPVNTSNRLGRAEWDVCPGPPLFYPVFSLALAAFSCIRPSLAELGI